MPEPRAEPTKAAIPLPSLKPGEVITWVKLERPRMAIGEIVVSSFLIVGFAIAAAIGIGMVLGHVRSNRKAQTHGAGGLGLR